MSFVDQKIFILILLLILAIISSISARFLRIPYSVGLVIIGLILGLNNNYIIQLIPIQFDYKTIVIYFLPCLIFDAIWNIDTNYLIKNTKNIAVLAFVGVILSIFFSYIIMHLIFKINTATCLLFGAIISATDPISVLALFKNSKINFDLIAILEGESLFNDAISVVFYNYILQACLTNNLNNFDIKTFDGSMASSFIGSLIYNILASTLIGAIIGIALSKINKILNDHLLAMTISVILAYFSFILADIANCSGIISTIIAGIVFVRFGAKLYMDKITIGAIDSFWQFLSFIVNSFIFLIIGLKINLIELLAYWQTIIIGLTAIILARIFLVYGLGFIYHIDKQKISLNFKHILSLSAMRGGLSMVLAINIPNTIAQRNEIIVLTFGVVLVSIIIPGLSIEFLAKKLKIID